MILGSYTPYISTLFQVFPHGIRHFMFPAKEIDTVTLTDTTYWTINEGIMIGDLDAVSNG